MTRRNRRSRNQALSNRNQGTIKNPPSQSGGAPLSPHIVAYEHRETRTEVWNGPLPNPDALAKFDEIVPGSAVRLMDWAETQMNHRMSLENTAISNDTYLSRLGLILGFTLNLAVIGAAIYVTSLGKTIEGLATALLTIFALIVSYFKAIDKKNKDLKEHRGDDEKKA